MPADAKRRHVETVSAPVESGSRTWRFVLSDGTVDRYGDTIDPNGWVLDNFLRNPVALADHKSDTDHVLGRWINLAVRKVGGILSLVGDLEFAPPGVSKLADTICGLVALGLVRTVSVGFAPLEYELSKTRQGGIDFKKHELLECSVVPVPANPNALQIAASAGLDGRLVGAILRAAVASEPAQPEHPRKIKLASHRPVHAPPNIRDLPEVGYFLARYLPAEDVHDAEQSRFQAEILFRAKCAVGAFGHLYELLEGAATEAERIIVAAHAESKWRGLHTAGALDLPLLRTERR